MILFGRRSGTMIVNHVEELIIYYYFLAMITLNEVVYLGNMFSRRVLLPVTGLTEP